MNALRDQARASVQHVGLPTFSVSQLRSSFTRFQSLYIVVAGIACVAGCVLSESWTVLAPVCFWAAASLWVFGWRGGHCVVRGVTLQPLALRVLIGAPSAVAFVALADEWMFNLVLITAWAVLLHALCRKATKESGDEDLLEAGRTLVSNGAFVVAPPPAPHHQSIAHSAPLSPMHTSASMVPASYNINSSVVGDTSGLAEYRAAVQSVRAKYGL